VMQMDELTQQNAALVEEATAASQAMAQQVRGLNDMLERYRVSEQIASAAAQRQAETAAPVAAQASRAERRGATRPWSNRARGEAGGAAASAPKAAQAAAAGRANGAPAVDAKADTEWREF